MLRTIAITCLAGSAMALAGCQSTGEAAAAADPGAEAMFERLKGLEGTWLAEAVEEEGMVAEPGTAVTYEVTSAGSAVVETIFEDQPHEMVTVYFLDNGALKLTHYCAMGNQPHMVAEPLSGPDEVKFTCVGAGNTKSHDDPHMHWGHLQFRDDGGLEAYWTMAEKLEPGMVAHILLRRADN